MTISLDQIDWCDVPLLTPMPDLSWERQSTKRLGFCSSIAKYLTPVRWMLQADELMHARLTPHVPVELMKLISLVVAMDSSCRHCYGAFRSMLKIMGYSEATIRRLEESFAVDGLSDREKAALEFARKISHAAPRPSAEDLGQLGALGYSNVEIAELAYLGAINATANRLATLLALPPDPLEEIEANWFDKIKRPFSRRDLMAALTPIFKVDRPPAYSGPGQKVLRLFEESPAGAALVTVFNGAWESPITSRQVKALVFGVVARGLGCAACEAEAGEALKKEGWTAAEVDEVLTHLNSDRLDPFELKVLAFSRETVRYQTRRIQDIAQTFAVGLDREVLVEVLGLVCYANGLARLSILLYSC